MNSKDVAIWLYGSFARGCEDQYSDLDILIVGVDPFLLHKEELLSLRSDKKLSPSYYTWSEIESMASYGSLFLQHLSLEARPILETDKVKGRLFKILNCLRPYKRARLDIESFFQVVNDVEESIKHDCSLIYELSVLGTVLRHSCILGCYISGFRVFGRSEPIEKFIHKWNLDPSISDEFDQLYRYRLHSERNNCEIEEIRIDDLLLWCSRIKLVLNKLKEQVNVYEREMLATNY